jgi:glutathione S-transferase
MIKVHHLNRSRSKRVIWLLEELALTYSITYHQRDPKTQLAPKTLQAVHPLAKAPVIEDDGKVLCESAVILEYILNTYTEGKSLRPAENTPQYYSYLEWLNFAEGSLSLAVISKLFMSMEDRTDEQPLDAYIAKELELNLSYIETTLSEQNYFAGDEFSAADIMMTIMLEIAQQIGLLEGKNHTLLYLDLVQSRSAYLRAAEKG